MDTTLTQIISNYHAKVCRLKHCHILNNLLATVYSKLHPVFSFKYT
jgi:hypothetical protein